jgi:hypothetical protein
MLQEVLGSKRKKRAKEKKTKGIKNKKRENGWKIK